MSHRFSVALVWATMVILPATARTAEVLRLVPEVTVAAEVVRAADVASNALGPELSEVILYAAPRPGFSLRISAAALQRRFVEIGAREVPRVEGDQVVVRATGARIATADVDGLLLDALSRLPVPGGAIAQSWEILHAPRLSQTLPRSTLTVLDPGPPVGRGSVRIRHGQRTAFVSVRRGLRVVGLRLAAPGRRGSDLSAAIAHPDTLWVWSRVDWQRMRRAAEPRAGWAFARDLAAGSLIRRADLRPALLVRRGQMVEWMVRRGDLEVRSTVRARSDGALGDWVLVQSPFDHRLRRVCVVGAGRVGSTPPPAVSSR